jgi:hypothetical protein
MFESSQGSQAFLEPKIEPLKGEKSPLLAGFCNFAPVSELSNWRTRRPFREKSPATTANIPVFGRLSLETRFDLHCVRGRASQPKFIKLGSLENSQSPALMSPGPTQGADTRRKSHRPSAQAVVRDWQRLRVRSSELQRPSAAFCASG